MLNKIRAFQGWNVLGPSELMPLIAAWAEQLDRHKAPLALYNDLLDRCVDVRSRALADGRKAPDLNVELFLSVFETYKSEVYVKVSYLNQLVERRRWDLSDLTEKLKDFDLNTHWCQDTRSESHDGCRIFHEKRREATLESAGPDAAEKATAELDRLEAELETVRRESGLFA